MVYIILPTSTSIAGQFCHSFTHPFNTFRTLYIPVFLSNGGTNIASLSQDSSASRTRADLASAHEDMIQDWRT